MELCFAGCQIWLPGGLASGTAAVSREHGRVHFGRGSGVCVEGLANGWGRSLGLGRSTVPNPWILTVSGSEGKGRLCSRDGARDS